MGLLLVFIELVFLLLAGTWLITAIHEVAHAVTAWANGIPVRLIRIGVGPGITFNLASTRIELRPIPNSGLILGDPDFGDLRAWKRMFAAGPLATLGTGVLFATLVITLVSFPVVQLASIFLTAICLLLGLSNQEVSMTTPYGTGTASTDRRVVRQLKGLNSKLSPAALDAIFGDSAATADAIRSLTAEVAGLDQPSELEIVVGRLVNRLMMGFDAEVGDAVIDLANQVPAELASQLRNLVIYEAAVNCWSDRAEDLLPMAADLLEKHPDSIGFADTYGALLTSIGRGAEGLPWMLDSADELSKLPAWDPRISRQLGLWNMFVAVAKQANGDPPESVAAHASAARRANVRSPLLAGLPAVED